MHPTLEHTARKPHRGLLKKLRVRIWHPVALALIYVVLGLLHLARLVKPVTILLLSEYRIGGFGPRTDFCLRQRRSQKGTRSRGLRVAIIGDPCNEQLLTMFQRHMHIFRSKMWVRVVNHNMTPRGAFTNILKGSRFFYRPPLPTWDDYELYETPPVLSFTKAEELRGKRLLHQMGVPEGAWFVCFHARDAAYFSQVFPGFASSEHRGGSITNCIAAMKYIASCGGYAVRVGAVAQERLPDLGNPRIIDYVSDYRSDFGDIYLLAKCRFFVGCNSGLTTVPMMFNVPVVDCNSLIMPTRSPEEKVYAIRLGRRDLFLPKPIYSQGKARLLTFREVLEPPVRYFADLHEYEGAGLRVLENSPEDILGATREINQRLDGRFTCTDEDEALQARFRSLIQPKPKSFDTFARVGAEFLRAHRDLLG